jgi:nucleotide-binding universal stress UspA family protein
MFKHILLPIDGSDLSLRAVDTGIELAGRLDASVYAFHVVVPFLAVTYFAEVIQLPADAYTEEAVSRAERYLAQARERASAAGVHCDSGYEFDHHPYAAIVGAATKHQCDLIVMASHGWRGFDRLLLGSETHKVILHGSVPVLVCR